MSANRNVGPVKRETGVNPVRCRRCKREVSGPFSFTVRKVQETVRDGKKEDKKGQRKSEDLLILLLLSRSMTFAKDRGRSASGCRIRVHLLIWIDQRVLFYGQIIIQNEGEET